jgi:chromosome partitioning protein
MTTLALYSNKGGVGKTTTAVNLSYLAAKYGRKTLICDLDPQSSTTFFFRVKPKIKPKARGFEKGGKIIDRSIKGTDYENLDLLPADFSHRNLDITFGKLRHRKHRLNVVLDPLKDEYDLIILDCPPTINILAENIFNVADKLLVPLMPTLLSERVYAILLEFLKDNGFDTDNVFAFFSMVNRYNKMHRDTGLSIFTQFKGIMLTPIPYAQEVEKMGVYREPVTVFAPESYVAKAYHDLWLEIQKKVLLEI